jgi:hypothetical protein
VADPELVLAEGHHTISSSVLDAEEEAVLEMPSGSMTPVATAAGIALVVTGILSELLPLALLGAGVVVLGLLAWFRMQEEHH